jgi:hypothetical protein
VLGSQQCALPVDFGNGKSHSTNSASAPLHLVKASCSIFTRHQLASATVPALPAKGQVVYARLSSYINGAWQFNDYQYTESWFEHIRPVLIISHVRD